MSNVTSIWNGGSIYCVLFLRVPSSPKFNLLSFRRFVVLPPGIYFSHTSLHSHHFPITQTSNFSIFLKWVFFKILSFPSITDFYSCLCSYVWLLPSPNFHSLLKVIIVYTLFILCNSPYSSSPLSEGDTDMNCALPFSCMNPVFERDIGLMMGVLMHLNLVISSISHMKFQILYVLCIRIANSPTN